MARQRYFARYNDDQERVGFFIWADTLPQIVQRYPGLTDVSERPPSGGKEQTQVRVLAEFEIETPPEDDLLDSLKMPHEFGERDPKTGKIKFVAVYDYYTGGVWYRIWAKSMFDIATKYPGFNCLSVRMPEFTKDWEEGIIKEIDVDDPVGDNEFLPYMQKPSHSK